MGDDVCFAEKHNGFVCKVKSSKWNNMLFCGGSCSDGLSQTDSMVTYQMAYGSKMRFLCYV